MKNIDWTLIKNEYISSEVSMRKLAAKHNVDLKSIATHSKQEEWVAQRKEYRNRVQAKTLQNLEDAASNFQAEVSGSARKLLDKKIEITYMYGVYTNVRYAGNMNNIKLKG